MSKRVLMKGNEAVASGAIAGGCRRFFGYPITPQNQIPEYMSEHLPRIGGVYLQAESEVAAINMVLGAATTGVRVMTSSSSPGVSLMQEGISFIIACELPCVLVNMVRGGPGLGNIGPAQSDYWMATRGSHGDGRCLTFAPYSVQELHDWTADAFDIAERYRTPVMILGDGILAQMLETCTPRPWDVAPTEAAANDWAVGGIRNGRERRIVNSLLVDLEELEDLNWRIQRRYDLAAANETVWDEYGHEDPELVLCAYGISARVCVTAVDWAVEQGIRVRLVRPISLFPFPTAPIAQWAERVDDILVCELSMGQFVEDVRLAVNGQCDVHLKQRAGGAFLSPEEVLDKIVALCR